MTKHRGFAGRYSKKDGVTFILKDGLEVKAADLERAKQMGLEGEELYQFLQCLSKVRQEEAPTRIESSAEETEEDKLPVPEYPEEIKPYKRAKQWYTFKPGEVKGFRSARTWYEKLFGKRRRGRR